MLRTHEYDLSVHLIGWLFASLCLFQALMRGYPRSSFRVACMESYFSMMFFSLETMVFLQELWQEVFPFEKYGVYFTFICVISSFAVVPIEMLKSERAF